MRNLKTILVVLLLAVIGIAFLFLPIREWFQQFQARVAELGAAAPVVVALAYGVMTVMLIPGSALTIGSGTLFGMGTGLLVVIFGANIGALCSFLLARTFLREKVAQWAESRPKFRFLDLAIGRSGFKMVLLLRLAPIFPFALLNYLLGLTAVRTGAYVTANLLGMFPGILLYVYIGALARDALAGGMTTEATLLQQILKYVGLAATVMVIWVVTRMARQAINEAESMAKLGPGAGPGASPAPSESAEAPTPINRMMLVEDPHDQKLVENCHPPKWSNPKPAGKYNLVVLGAGTAGLVCAAGAAGLGAKVALIERSLLGGDCLNVGCVPSKGVIRASRAVFDATHGAPFGVELGAEPAVDFSRAMERMRRLRAGISDHDSVRRFTGLGVDVFLGSGRFVGGSALEVDGQRLEFDRAVIATGARAAELPVPGLAEAGYFTNETVFTLTELPRRLAVIGAGPIGCELAQSFARFGSEVYLIEALHGILPNEDPDAAEIVRRSMMERDGVKLMCCGKELKVSGADGATKRLTVDSHGDHYDIIVDAIIVGGGRTPNVEGLGLEAAGVKYSRQGVEVDDRLRTSNPRIYAAGDICSRYKFTHAADAMARIVLANALFFSRRKVSRLVIPWCTYTDPELAHVGHSEASAKASGFEPASITESLGRVDRALLDGEEEGMARVTYDKKSGKILGGTIVARHAGEMIGELTLAISTGQKMTALASTIHPYPTQAEVLKKIGDAYMRQKLTPTVKKLFDRWFAWRR